MSPTATNQFHGSYVLPSLEHATVADAMHPGILSCEPDVPLSEVARMMASHHVHCIAVIGISHQAPECAVWGIISDSDLVKAGIRGDEEATARDLALAPVISVKPTLPLREAGELMLGHQANHLAVVGETHQRPVGILSLLDIAGVLAWGEA